MDNKQSKLKYLEYMRGFAALLVVFYHISRMCYENFGFYPFSKITEVGHVGVDFFFVLSGFIIIHAHLHDVGKGFYRCKEFIVKRVIRIYPVLWLCLIFSLVLVYLSNSLQYQSIKNIIFNFILIPQESGLLTVGVSWTLQHEILFYIFFSLVILRKEFVLIVLLWLIFILYSNYFSLSEFLNSVPAVFSSFNTLFFFGIAAYFLSKKMSTLVSLVMFLFGAIAVVAVLCFEVLGIVNGFVATTRLMYGFCFMLLISSIVVLECLIRSKPKKDVKILSILGKSSYSLYLFHLIIGGVLQKILLISGVESRSVVALMYFLIITLCVYISNIIYKYFEAPMLKFMRNRFIKKEGSF